MVNIGPPITLPVTAAIPATANKAVLAFGIKVWKITANIHPNVVPINKAGEKIPPKRFNRIQSTVRNSLVKRSIIKYVIGQFSTSKDWIVSEPKPSTSGTNKPIIPHITPAIIGKRYVGIF